MVSVQQEQGISAGFVTVKHKYGLQQDNGVK